MSLISNSSKIYGFKYRKVAEESFADCKEFEFEEFADCIMGDYDPAVKIYLTNGAFIIHPVGDYSSIRVGDRLKVSDLKLVKLSRVIAGIEDSIFRVYLVSESGEKTD